MNETRSGTRSRLRGRTFGAFAALPLVLVLSTCGSGSGTGSESSAGGGGAEQTWVHGILTPKNDSGYQLMAKERGYFEKMGVNVEIKQFTGNVQVVQALVSGAIDSADSAPAPLIDAHLKGAGVTAIGSTLPKITYVVISKASIKDFEDLVGGTIGASAPGAFPDSVVRAMLFANGLNPNDLRVVNAGSDSQRFKALLNGRIDAAAVGVGFVPKIENNPNFHVLGRASKIIPKYPRFYLWANNDALQSKSQAAVKFLAARMKGVCYSVQNPQAEIALAAKKLNVSTDDPAINYAQQVISEANAASPTAAIPLSKIEYLQKLRIKEGFQQEKIDLSEIVDRSYRAKALQLANLPKECLNDPNAEQLPEGIQAK